MNRSALLILAAALAGALQAQTTNPLIAESKAAYTGVKNNFLKAAEKMPEDAYSFKPTPEVQSWGERIAHVANQIGTCSSLTGERKQSQANGKTAKADLVAALKASFDACDAAWDSMNDKTAMEMVAGRGGQQTSKLGTLIRNTNHDSEMYGYLSVYMRMKGVVPPSSEPRN
ncbi:MAG TPA: DinB family protein [Bryobacteraceae bacterium]